MSSKNVLRFRLLSLGVLSPNNGERPRRLVEWRDRPTQPQLFSLPAFATPKGGEKGVASLVNQPQASHSKSIQRSAKRR